LSRLYTYIDTQEYKTALDGDKSKTMRGEQIYGLTYIVNNYKGTKSGKLAAVFAGNCYLKMNQPQKAIEYFEISLKGDDFNVLEGANAGLGCAYEMNKQMEKHLSIIQKQANMQLMMKIKQGICFFQLYA